MGTDIVLWALSGAATMLSTVLGWLCIVMFKLNSTMRMIEARNDERHAANLREFDKIWKKLENF